MSRIYWLMLFSCICSARISSAVTTNAPCPCRRLNECPFNFRVAPESAPSTLPPCESGDFVRCCESTQETVAHSNVDRSALFQGEIHASEVNGAEEVSEPASGPLRRLVEFMRNGVFGFMNGNRKAEAKSVPYVTEIQASVPLTVSSSTAGPTRNFESSKYFNTRNNFRAENTRRIIQRPAENYPENVGMNILNNVHDVMDFMDNQGTVKETALTSQPIRLVRILNDSPMPVTFHGGHPNSGYGKVKISGSSDQPKNVRFDQPNVEENRRSTEDEDAEFPNDEDDQSPLEREIEENMSFESLRVVPKKTYYLSSHNKNAPGQPNQFPSYAQTGFHKLRKLKSLDSQENAFTMSNFGNSGDSYEIAEANIPTRRGARSENSYHEGESNFRSTSEFGPKKVNNFPKQKTSLETFLALDRASVRAVNENTPNLMSIHDDTSLGNLLHSEELRDIKRLARSHFSHVNNESSLATEENLNDAISNAPTNSTQTKKEGHKKLTSAPDLSKRRLVRIRVNQNKATSKIRRANSRPNNKVKMNPKSSPNTTEVYAGTTSATDSKIIEISTISPVKRFKRPPRILPTKGAQSEDQKSRRSHVSFEDSRQRTLDLLKSSERTNHMTSIINRGFKGRKVNAMSSRTLRTRKTDDTKNDTNSEVKPETSVSGNLIKNEGQEGNQNTNSSTDLASAFNSGNTLLESDKSPSENGKPISAKHQRNRVRKLHSSNASPSSRDAKVPSIIRVKLISKLRLESESQPKGKVARHSEPTNSSFSDGNEEVLTMGKRASDTNADDKFAGVITSIDTPTTVSELEGTKRFNNNDFEAPTESVSDLIRDMNMDKAVL